MGGVEEQGVRKAHQEGNGKGLSFTKDSACPGRGPGDYSKTRWV